MKISKASTTGKSCHPADGKFGCFEDCAMPATMTGSISGDYLLIPGGMYNEPPAGNADSPVTMHKNDYYCGEGLANKNGMVRVDMPGPVTVRS